VHEQALIGRREPVEEAMAARPALARASFEKRFDIASAMIDVQDLDTVWTRTVEDQIILKTRDAPGAHTSETRVAKSSRTANIRIGGEKLKGLIDRFNDTSSRVRVIGSDKIPNLPKLVLDARIKNELIFGHGAP